MAPKIELQEIVGMIFKDNEQEFPVTLVMVGIRGYLVAKFEMRTASEKNKTTIKFESTVLAGKAKDLRFPINVMFVDSAGKAAHVFIETADKAGSLTFLSSKFEAPLTPWPKKYAKGITLNRKEDIMENENGEKIVAYRIGESLFCVDCYEKTAKALKAVQNPEDPQVTIPSTPIKQEDLHTFVCNDCKKIYDLEKSGVSFGISISSGREDQNALKKAKDELIDLCDAITRCAARVSFLKEMFAKGGPGEEFEISERASVGLYFILSDIEDNLNSARERIR
ncbi:MAG: hypothetical protein ACE144_20565 [Thermodesulfobacteriota bacterium]